MMRLGNNLSKLKIALPVTTTTPSLFFHTRTAIVASEGGGGGAIPEKRNKGSGFAGGISKEAKKEANAHGGDKRFTAIQAILYNKDRFLDIQAHTQQQSSSSATSVVNGDVCLPAFSSTTTSNPSVLSPAQQHEQHQLIERMWALEKSAEARAIVADVTAKFMRMREAMEELERTDARLFAGANNNEDVAQSAPVTFPRKLRVPTETLGQGWVYDITKKD